MTRWSCSRSPRDDDPRRVRRLIAEQRAAGRTVFLTTHDMAVADELCDRVAFIVDGRIATVGALDVTPYYRMVLAIYFLPFVPLLAGWVVGFLLLDERDDPTLMALQVTPLTLLVVPLSGVNQVGPGALLLAALAGAPVAPMASLYLAAFATNKVQGFALLKRCRGSSRCHR